MLLSPISNTLKVIGAPEQAGSSEKEKANNSKLSADGPTVKATASEARIPHPSALIATE